MASSEDESGFFLNSLQINQLNKKLKVVFSCQIDKKEMNCSEENEMEMFIEILDILLDYSIILEDLKNDGHPDYQVSLIKKSNIPLINFNPKIKFINRKNSSIELSRGDKRKH
jgi:hypothetical protein